jgi:hypothetical protein
MQEVRPMKQDSSGLASLEKALAGCDTRHVSLVLLHIEDLTELRIVCGSAVFRTAVETIHHVLGRAARGHGFAARTGPTDYSLVLPELYKREAQALVNAQMGRPPRFEFDAEGEEFVLVPEVAVDLLGRGESIRQCHARLRADMVKAIERERARLAAMTKLREKLVARVVRAPQPA